MSRFIRVGVYIANAGGMVLRIEKSNHSGYLVLALSGRIENEKIRELQEILALERPDKKIAFDLENVRLVDQQSVEFLEECEAKGIELWNCPVYLREWIERIQAARRVP